MRYRTYLLVVAQLAVASTLSAQDRAVADTSDLCSAERFPKHFTDWKASHPAYHAAVEPTSEERVHDAPVRKRSPVLEYPRQARRDGYEGVVLLEAVVGVDGRVVFAEVLESTVRRLTPIGVSPRNREVLTTRSFGSKHFFGRSEVAVRKRSAWASPEVHFRARPSGSRPGSKPHLHSYRV